MKWASVLVAVCCLLGVSSAAWADMPPSTSSSARAATQDPAADNAQAAAAPSAPAPPPVGLEAAEPKTVFGESLSKFNAALTGVLFWDISLGAFRHPKLDAAGNPMRDPANGKLVMAGATIPFIVAVLALGAVFFTFWYRFINLRAFRHAIDVVRGKYDDPADEGEISHFRALTSALSATVGLGNIAGVAIAIQKGGPGAVFWMIVMAIFGMSAKFSSCTLAVLHRQQNPDGSVSGGPMYYLDLGLKKLGVGPLGKVLGVMYALMVMGGSFGGGNMFQSNQSFAVVKHTAGLGDGAKYVYGVIIAVAVGLVIIGGIKRIGAATARVVPLMCGVYVLASVVVIIANAGQIPEAISTIVSMAFTKNAVFGGAVGVLVIGVTRAAFSNEAGLGSAAIAHAAAKTDEPVREGMVAMLGPFIDTIIICSMTALIVVVTGTWKDPGTADGVVMTSTAFASVMSWFPWVLSLCVVMFAYSTMISWCYYGERGWIYLFDHAGAGVGLRSVVVFRVLFVVASFLGAVMELGPVLDFSDLMILCMAFPNILGSVILAPQLLKLVQDYWRRYTSGEMQPYQAPAADAP